MIKLQILLRKERRTPEGITMVKEIAASLGIKPTTSGAASISGEIDPKAFEVLFGTRAEQVGARPPSGSDYGSPGGAVSSALRIPEPLQNHVENITVAPPHIRMNHSGRERLAFRKEGEK